MLWYLYAPDVGDALVLASYPVEGVDVLEELDGQDDGTVAEASSATRMVAHGFAEFLYRYWLENNVWFKKSLKLPLSRDEANYVGQS